MPICRVHAKSNYTVINNKLLRSKNLSCAATGLLCKVMSFPEDFRQHDKSEQKSIEESKRSDTWNAGQR